MQKMPDMVQHTPIFFPIRVRNRLPVELQQRFGLVLMNIPVVHSFNSLELKPQQMFQRYLRVTVSKRVRGPADFVYVPKLLVHPVHAHRVLVQNIVVVAYCLVVLDPATISDI